MKDFFKELKAMSVKHVKSHEGVEVFDHEQVDYVRITPFIVFSVTILDIWFTMRRALKAHNRFLKNILNETLILREAGSLVRPRV